MKVTTKGQITIPKNIRKRYGIHPGTEIEVADSNGEIVVRKAGSKNAVDRVYGILKDRTTWQASDELVKRLRDGP